MDLQEHRARKPRSFKAFFIRIMAILMMSAADPESGVHGHSFGKERWVKDSREFPAGNGAGGSEVST